LSIDFIYFYCSVLALLDGPTWEAIQNAVPFAWNE